MIHLIPHACIQFQFLIITYLIHNVINNVLINVSNVGTFRFVVFPLYIKACLRCVLVYFSLVKSGTKLKIDELRACRSQTPE